MFNFSDKIVEHFVEYVSGTMARRVAVASLTRAIECQYYFADQLTDVLKVRQFEKFEDSIDAR
jgi:hypothetical protein